MILYDCIDVSYRCLSLLCLVMGGCFLMFCQGGVFGECVNLSHVKLICQKRVFRPDETTFVFAGSNETVDLRGG